MTCPHDVPPTCPPTCPRRAPDVSPDVPRLHMISTVHRFLVSLVLLPVVVYRCVGFLLKRGPSCIYLPTCSDYAMQAVRGRGIVIGSALAISRILRCNPLFHGGYHPVSDNGSARRCTYPQGYARSPRSEMVLNLGQRPAARTRADVLGPVEEQH